LAERKIKIARLWSRYNGNIPSRSGIIMGLDSSRFDTICIYLMKNSDKPNYFEEKGLKAYYISRKRFLRMFNLLVIWKLSRILKREKIDILHCHRYQATIYGAVAALLAGTKVVISHVHGISRTRNLKRKLTNFFILKKVNKIVTVGQAVREDVLRANPHVKPDKVVSIGNSIDYQNYANVSLTKAQAKDALSLPSDSFVFGTVARFGPYKGHNFLIRAFEKVKKELPSVHLVFAGEGRLRSQLEQQAAQTLYADSIHFLGRRDNVPELLKAMDAYVQPSIGSEGLPRSILEAMAAGVPCIATDVGGNREVIPDSSVGLLVPPRDADALANAMVTLAQIPTEGLKRYAEKARQRVRLQYCHDVVKAKLAGLYEEEYATAQQRRR